MEFNVMSFNIHSGIGMDGTYDMSRIAQVIEESEADVIGLQEIDVHWGERSNFENGVQLLAEALHMDAFFAPIYDLPPIRQGDPNRQFGVAILSKFPIIKAANWAMTRLSTQQDNLAPQPMPGVADVLIQVHGTLVNVYSAHLDFRSDAALRSQQVQELLTLMHENNYAKILCSDCNAVPSAPELSPLFSNYNHTWAKVYTGTEPGYTFPADAPVRTIDYIFCSRTFVTKSSQIIATEVSDHRPVITRLVLPTK